MRLVIAASCLVICTTLAAAQNQSQDNQSQSNQSQDKKPGDSPYSDSRAVDPSTKGVLQPQGWTGPLTTDSGGASAASPQGGTPPGMQSTGGTKTVVDPSAPGR
jgi:hypothetical protein